MKFYFFLFFILTTSTAVLSQDILETMDGRELEVKVEEIGVNTIKFRKFNNLDGPVYEMKKIEVMKITFENGTQEFIAMNENFRSISLEDTQNILIEKINEYAFEHGNDKKTYVVSFEDNYLRLRLKHFKGDFYGEGELFDMGNVYEFQRISKRDGNIAFINIYVSKLKNKKKNTWEKYKLVMLVKGYDNALFIMDGLKHYNHLLQSEKR